jgi:hypothetical protein
MTGKTRAIWENILALQDTSRGSDAAELLLAQIEDLLDSLAVLEISDEEWAAHPDAKGWTGHFTVSYEIAFSKSTPGFTYIPRPAPAKLTDAEIKYQSEAKGLEAHDMVNRQGEPIIDCLEAYRLAHDAEKARLEKEAPK